MGSNRVRNHTIVWALSGMAVLLAVPADAAPTPIQAQVINTAANPVQTAVVNGKVQVPNPEATPVFIRSVEGPTRQPFQQTVAAQVNQNEISLDVPAGKMLVIEMVSVTIIMPAGKRAGVYLSGKMASGSVGEAQVFIPLADQGDFGSGSAINTHLVGTVTGMNIRAIGAGSVKLFSYNNASLPSPEFMYLSVSGYLVNL